MAGDWIKVEKVTPDKPEIAIFARLMKCSLGDAFLAWFRLYSWADGISVDGFVPNLSLCEGDTLARTCPGTCATLASKQIGWLKERDGGIEFVNWDRHNGRSAKARASERNKKKRQREAARICPDDVPVEPGPEKRREEKREEEEKSPRTASPANGFPDVLNTDSFRQVWAKWEQHRTEIRHALKPTTRRAQLEKCARMGEAAATAAIHQSIEQGYMGLFEPKQSQAKSNGRAAELLAKSEAIK